MCPIDECSSHREFEIRALTYHTGTHYYDKLNRSSKPHEIFDDIHPIKCCSKKYILNNILWDECQKTQWHKKNMSILSNHTNGSKKT